MLQFLFSSLITVYYIPKSMYVELFLYFSIKVPLVMTKSMYYKSVKAISIWILDFKVIQFRGNNTEHNITNHMFTPNSSF